MFDRDRRLRLVALLGTGGALAVLTALRPATPPDAGTGRRHEILMQSVRFAPAELRVSLGDTVMWHNTDIVRHNAVRPGAFDTGEMGPDGWHAWVPADTGTYSYRCTIHQRMRGTVIVAK